MCYGFYITSCLMFTSIETQILQTLTAITVAVPFHFWFVIWKTITLFLQKNIR